MKACANKLPVLTFKCGLCEKSFGPGKQLGDHMREHILSVVREESGDNGRAMPSSDHMPGLTVYPARGLQRYTLGSRDILSHT